MQFEKENRERKWKSMQTSTTTFLSMRCIAISMKWSKFHTLAPMKMISWMFHGCHFAVNVWWNLYENCSVHEIIRNHASKIWIFYENSMKNNTKFMEKFPSSVYSSYILMYSPVILYIATVLLSNIISIYNITLTFTGTHYNLTQTSC